MSTRDCGKLSQMSINSIILVQLAEQSEETGKDSRSLINDSWISYPHRRKHKASYYLGKFKQLKY